MINLDQFSKYINKYKQNEDKVVVIMNTCKSAAWRIEAEKDKDINFVLINGRNKVEGNLLYFS